MKIWAIVRKEWLELKKNKAVFMIILVIPLLLSVFPMVMMVLMKGQPINLTKESLDFVKVYIPDATPQLAAQFIMISQNLLMLMLVPIIVPLTIGIYSIIGEKESRSLEVLLAEPIKTWEILMGKILAAVAPGVVCAWSAFLVLVLGTNFFAAPETMQYVMHPMWIFVMAATVPLLTLFSITVAVIISSRVNDVRVAQLLSGFATLPVVGLSLSQLFNKITIDWNLILGTAFVLAVIDGMLFMISIVIFDRDAILTRWK